MVWEVLRTDDQQCVLWNRDGAALRKHSLTLTDAVKFCSTVIILYWAIIIYSVIFILKREITFEQCRIFFKKKLNIYCFWQIYKHKVLGMWGDHQTFSGHGKNFNICSHKAPHSLDLLRDDTIYILFDVSDYHIIWIYFSATSLSKSKKKELNYKSNKGIWWELEEQRAVLQKVKSLWASNNLRYKEKKNQESRSIMECDVVVIMRQC